MTTSRNFILMLLLISGVCSLSANAQRKNDQSMTTNTGDPATKTVSATDDEAAIRALEDRFAMALNAGDFDAIMKNYVRDTSLFVFDVVPRKEYYGADNYRKDWEDFFSHFRGTPKIVITDLGIAVGGNVAFSHSFQRITGTDKQGRPVDRMVRVTDGYRKIGDDWLIALEHVSMPVDLATGKAVQSFTAGSGVSRFSHPFSSASISEIP